MLPNTSPWPLTVQRASFASPNDSLIVVVPTPSCWVCSCLPAGHKRTVRFPRVPGSAFLIDPLYPWGTLATGFKRRCHFLALQGMSLLCDQKGLHSIFFLPWCNPNPCLLLTRMLRSHGLNAYLGLGSAETFQKCISANMFKEYQKKEIYIKHPLVPEF